MKLSKNDQKPSSPLKVWYVHLIQNLFFSFWFCDVIWNASFYFVTTGGRQTSKFSFTSSLNLHATVLLTQCTSFHKDRLTCNILHVYMFCWNGNFLYLGFLALFQNRVKLYFLFKLNTSSRSEINWHIIIISNLQVKGYGIKIMKKNNNHEIYI